jgi:hypothetical protein
MSETTSERWKLSVPLDVAVLRVENQLRLSNGSIVEQFQTLLNPKPAARRRRDVADS